MCSFAAIFGFHFTYCIALPLVPELFYRRFLFLLCDRLSFSFSLAVPSQPPQNVRAITVTSDEAVITWSEPPRMTLNGVLKGYRVVFWSLYPDGGGCCGGQTLGLNQSNYKLLLLLPH